MKKLLVLNLHGDFEAGFDVSWEIGPDGQRPAANGISRGALLPRPDLVQIYEHWQNTYRSLDGNRIKQQPNPITNVRYTDLLSTCHQTADTLAKVVNEWFDGSRLGRMIDEDLLTNIEDEYRVIISTNNNLVRQIPWFLWTGWNKFQYLEISLGVPYTQRRDRIYQQDVRVLVILGNSDGINIEIDRQILEKYDQDGTWIEFLPQPSIQSLRCQLSDKRGWDLIFFSGHSRTERGNSGRIYLNQTDSLTMAQLRSELTTAIDKGLQLAIFNSCDGLGIAAELESLYIPQVIVMRQPVPDRVAQDFLKYFLAEFTSGKSLYQSVSMARRKLEKLESKFPCASWLPVIIQNRWEIPPTWQSLGSIPKCPYRGLAAFTEADRDYFHGRESFVQALGTAIKSRSIVALIGASGSGKSSLIFAGLVPQLRPDWHIVSLRPETNPIQSLGVAVSSILSRDLNTEDLQLLELELIRAIGTNSSALVDFISQHQLVSPDRCLVIIIDQFEELYTLAIDRSGREQFLNNILMAIAQYSQVKLLLTLRADCYHYILSDPILANVLASISIKPLIPMTRSELTNTIVIPAQKLNVKFEEGLIEKILDAVFTREYSLPLLEFALTQLWAKQENGYLTHRAYQNIGGVEQALTNHAETIYHRLTSNQQEQVRNIFIQLIWVGDNVATTRRIAKRSEIGEDNWNLVNDLAAARLVVIDRSELAQSETVELIHEALIYHWQTFAGWIELDGDFRRWQEQLRSYLTQWEKSDRDNGGLIRGKSLDTAENWLIKYSSQISPLEHDFISLSLTKRKQEDRSKKLLQQSIIGGLTMGLAIVSLMWQQSEVSRQESVNNNIISSVKTAELLFKSGRQLDALQAAQKAGELIAQESSLDSSHILPAIATLEDISTRIDQRKILTLAHQDTITSVAYSPSGKMIVSIGNDGLINIYDLDGKIIQSLAVEHERFSKLIIANNEQIIITVSEPNILRLWSRNLLTSKWSNQNSVTADQNITAVGLDPKSQTLAVALDAGRVQLYKIFNNILTKDRLLPIADYIEVIKFTPDSRKIVAANADGTVKIWTDFGKLLTTLDRHQGAKISALTISPDGNKLAIGNQAGIISLWDIDGKLLDWKTDRKQETIDLDFSHNGQLVASVGKDKKIKIWEIDNLKLKLLKVFSGYADSIQSVNFSADDKTLVTGSNDGSVIFWQVDNTSNNSILPDGAKSFSYSPDGELLVLGGTAKGNANIINLRQHKVLHSFPIHTTQSIDTSISADRQYLAIVSSINHEVKLWDINDEKQVKTSIALTGYHCKFSPNQSILAIATMDNNVRIYDLKDGSIKDWAQEPSNLTYLSFSPDGASIITGDLNGQVKLRSLDGKLLLPPFLPEQGAIEDVSYNLDLAMIAIASDRSGKTGKVTLWSRRDGKLKNTNSLLDTVTGITSLTFSQDGKVLLTGNKDGILQLWNLKGKLLQTISPNNRISEISKVRFGSHDREIMAIDIQGKIIYHNLELKQLLKKANDWLK